MTADSNWLRRATVGAVDQQSGKKREIRRAANVLLVIISTIGVIVAAAAPAAAASGSGRAEGAGVRVSAGWTWNTASLTNVGMSVSDTAYDAQDVYGRLRIYQGSRGYVDTTIRRNSLGCGSVRTWYNLSFYGSFNITGVRVYACVDEFGSDRCYRSNFIDNPRT